MTKQEILDQFRDINYAYNNCTKLDTLSAMLDELLEAAFEKYHAQAMAEGMTISITAKAQEE